MPVIAVGLITVIDQAEAIIAGGDADAVALARGILYDTRWPWHAAAQLGAMVPAPKQYLRCQPSRFKRLFEPVTGDRRALSRVPDGHVTDGQADLQGTADPPPIR